MIVRLARSGGGRARSGVVRSVRGAEEKIVALIWFDLSNRYCSFARVFLPKRQACPWGSSIEGSGNASNPATNGITYNTLQSTFISNAADQALGVLSFPGGSSGANLYSLTLSSGLDADILSGGLVSLRLYAADNQVSYLFSSRAMPALSQPQLIVTAVPEPASLALAGLFSIWLHRFCRRTIGLPATKPNPQAPSARVAGSGTATRVSSGRGEAVPKLRESEG
jgi:hypothetical protein